MKALYSEKALDNNIYIIPNEHKLNQYGRKINNRHKTKMLWIQ